MSRRIVLILIAVAGAAYSQAPGTPDELKVEHAECVFFGKDHDKFVGGGKGAKNASPGGGAQRYALSETTEEVVAQLPKAPAGTRTANLQNLSGAGNIDRYLFQAMQAAGVTPAPMTTDFEFIRRATLDLTGRIPAPERVQSFVADPAPDKRPKLVDELLAKPEWLDKWTMFFGDLFKNNSRNTQIVRYAPGVLAFNNWLRNALQNNEPYDQMARELIAAQGANSYTQGELNWTVGGVVTGGPVQDLWDQQTANNAETFLGIAHVNCLLCHNGRGHLDALSLWGSQTTRAQAWGLASFLSHTESSRTPVAGAVNNQPYYWSVLDGTRYTKDYALNTTTGNRPARQPQGAQTTAPPVYLFNGHVPAPGENYRAALAREMTSDFQFARAAVNYFWEYFFGIGLVTPSNQFDPARLDPDNPPPGTWTLQPSNPRLLNALAQDFVNSKYDVKGLMRQIVTSRAYQLSARYDGVWNPAWERLFARKLVRRLWAEEIHDAVAQSSNVLPSYTNPIYGKTSWAMQLAEPLGTPDGAGPVATFLDAFLRGNRDDEQRRPDGSISQALDLMNDNLVMSRVQFAKAPAGSLLARVANLPDDQVVSTLFLNVLSRYPTDAEKATALGNLSSANRKQEIENLLWSLYNKVDFIFNY